MKKEFKNLSKPLVFGLALGLLIAAGISFVKVSAHGKYPEGTVVAGVDVSRMTATEAQEKLSTAVDEFFKKPLKINGTDFQPIDVGVQFLVGETLGTLRAADARKITIFNWLFGRSAKKKDYPLLVRIDYDKAYKALDQAFSLSEKAPVEAAFYFENGRRLAIREEKSGTIIDKEKFFNDLKTTAQNLRESPIEIKFTDLLPKVKAADLESQRERIEKEIRQRITLVDPVYSDDWGLSLAEHLDWVSFTTRQKTVLPIFGIEFESEKSANQIAIEIDQDKLDQFVDAEISKWLDVPVTPVNIYTDEDGKVIIEGEGADGKMVQRKHLKKAIELAVSEGIQNVPIPVITLSPEVTVSEDLKELGIKERLSVGHTSYYGSPPNRIYNIKVGAAKFNGLIVEPGQEFSFNEHLGPVDAENGYLRELVIKPEGTIPEYGGGICQVSTTFYRAVLFGGLPVTDRKPHSYAVSYYSQILGHGLDATIYLGSQDLKFVNDTESSILIQTFIRDDAELYVVFYGTSDGRKVEMDGPYLSGHSSAGNPEYIADPNLSPGQRKQTEKAHTGFKALWYRHIFLSDGTEKIETINSSYKAVPAKILVAPGSPELSGVP